MIYFRHFQIWLNVFCVCFILFISVQFASHRLHWVSIDCPNWSLWFELMIHNFLLFLYFVIFFLFLSIERPFLKFWCEPGLHLGHEWADPLPICDSCFLVVNFCFIDHIQIKLLIICISKLVAPSKIVLPHILEKKVKICWSE